MPSVLICGKSTLNSFPFHFPNGAKYIPFIQDQHELPIHHEQIEIQEHLSRSIFNPLTDTGVPYRSVALNAMLFSRPAIRSPPSGKNCSVSLQWALLKQNPYWVE
jgi:hypothetical protein